MTDEAEGGVIVAPSVLAAQLATSAGQPSFFLKSCDVVSAVGISGVGYWISCESWLIPELIVA